VRALVLGGDDGSLRLESRSVPALREGEALVRVLLAGICGTDLELLAGYKGFRGIPGHEFVGVVEKAPGPEWVGARVVAEINVACGRCGLCREGLRRHCERREVMGIAGRDGAFAQKLTVPMENLHRVPDSVSDEEAVFVEPLAAALGVMDVGIQAGDRALVVGDGRLGALIALGLRSRSVEVELVGRHREKLDLLRSLGVVVVSGDPRPVYPWVVEATGSPQGIEAARAWVRPRSTLVLKSTCHEPSTVDVSRIVVDEIRIVGSRCGDFPPALEALASKSVDVRPLISAVYPLERWEDAFRSSCQPDIFKVLLAA